MKIAHLDISNFRKLLSSRIDLSGETTLFVGANNSGNPEGRAKSTVCVFTAMWIVSGWRYSGEFPDAHHRTHSETAVTRIGIIETARNDA